MLGDIDDPTAAQPDAAWPDRSAPEAPARPLLSADARLCATLVLSLVVWSPVLLACLEGRTTLESATLRYVVTLAFAHLAVTLLLHLYSSYRGGRGVAAPRKPGPPGGIERRRNPY